MIKRGDYNIISPFFIYIKIYYISIIRDIYSIQSRTSAKKYIYPHTIDDYIIIDIIINMIKKRITCALYKHKITYYNQSKIAKYISHYLQVYII